MRLPILFATAVLGFACAFPASAAAQQLTLSFEREALSTPVGVEALYAEIEDAAQTVCWRAHRTTSVVMGRARRRAIESCVSDTIDVAVRAAGAPALERLHVRRTALDEAAALLAAAE